MEPGSLLSCTEGSKRGLGSDLNRTETRLIPGMEITCSGTLVGWTVSGRAGSGTMYPKLQIWRRSSTDQISYHKTGQEIQIDAQGSACEAIAQTCGQIFQCRLSAANQVAVQSGSDIIGVELPPLDHQGFELFFISSSRSQYVWQRELTSSSTTTGSQDLTTSDDVLFNIDVSFGKLYMLF